MDEGKERMIRFANRMIPSGLDGFAGWNRMNPFGIGMNSCGILDG